MKRLLTLFVLLTVSCSLSCSRNASPDPEPPGPDRMPLTIRGGIEAYTRASDGGFDDLDEVGIYVVNYRDAATPGNLSTEGNHATNVKHRYYAGSNGWNAESGDEIYWKDETTADIYGYWPYSAAVSSVTAFPFSVREDQSTAKTGSDPGGYEASDFLWVKKSAVTPQSAPVSLAFGHILSKAVVTLAAGAGFGELPAEGVVVRIVGTKRSATIDLGRGIATVDASGAAAPVTAKKEGAAYQAIVIPQTVESGTPLIEVVVDGRVYTHVGGYTFVPGKQHNLTITLKKAGSATQAELSSNGITAWTEDVNGYAGEAERILSERKALLAFYHALDGENWADHTNWCSDQPLGTWFGVTTDAEGHVTELNFTNNQLNGPFPKEIKFLKHLQKLSIAQNWNSAIVPTIGLSGPIPEEIAELRELVSLTLAGQPLTGGFPPELWQMTQLETLTISGTQLGGTIPPEIGNLVNLKSLSLHGNHLTGSIPPEIGRLTELRGLSLQENYLTGALPDEIRSLTKLESLTLGRYDNTNRIVITQVIGELTNLKSLFLAGNGLTSLPEEMGNLVNLSSLWLQNNDLTGSLPAWIGNLTNLGNFKISGNKLTGDIPDAVKNHPWWNMWNPEAAIYPQQDGYGFTEVD